jgi:hypothetical protein
MQEISVNLGPISHISSHISTMAVERPPTELPPLSSEVTWPVTLELSPLCNNWRRLNQGRDYIYSKGEMRTIKVKGENTLFALLK